MNEAMTNEAWHHSDTIDDYSNDQKIHAIPYSKERNLKAESYVEIGGAYYMLLILNGEPLDPVVFIECALDEEIEVLVGQTIAI